jgi:AhpD family alkylhydroperoxidase
MVGFNIIETSHVCFGEALLLPALFCKIRVKYFKKTSWFCPIRETRLSLLQMTLFMEQRLNIHAKGQNALKHLFGMGGYLKKSPVSSGLLHLLYFRVSQINGCAYCLDMHSKDARAEGETEQRLYGLSAWRETPYYTDRERAALAWAEAVTACEVPDEVYNELLRHFSEEEAIDLTIAVTTINTWNRINLSFPYAVGTYQIGQHN